MTKAALRKIYKQKRSWLPLPEEQKLTDRILINFQKVDLPYLYYMHTYIASEALGEVETIALMRYLQFKNPALKILVPRIDVISNEMQHVHFNDEVKLVKNAFGIEEPESGEIFSAEEIDLVLIPLLAFDKRGYRVGYGKGYYDKFLSKCREDALKIGLSFFEPEEQIDDINQFDIPLNYCITPQKIYEF